MLSLQSSNLYNNLIFSASSREAFYFQDQIKDGITYRIFLYRLASYTDFTLPDALESRGIMFEMNREIPVRLACRPPEKFFNLNENPFTQNVDLNSVKEVMFKVDGSLISTYIHNGHLCVKTKGSLASDQAIAAGKLLQNVENVSFFQELLTLEQNGYTVNMEYVGPTNRIVLGYENEDLIVLGIRDRETGKYFYPNPNQYPHLAAKWVSKVMFSNPIELINNVKQLTGIEGYVIRLSTGQHIKVKCDWYVSLHLTKDSINSPRRLYEVILDEGADDLLAMFYSDTIAVKLINEMKENVDKLYNHLVSTVETFYETNRALGRKDYAILGQKELDQLYFGLAMSKYLGKNVDFRDYMKRKYKDFGIKDERVNNEDEQDT